MNGAIFLPSNLCGAINAVSSKSEAHRILICAALCKTETTVHINNICEDVQATINCISAMGARFKKVACGSFIITPLWKNFVQAPLLNCAESGSTFRFLLPICAALGMNASFIGSGRLGLRPILPLVSALKSHGISFSSSELPLSISGKLQGGNFEISGDISSQFLTGLLLAAPLVSPCQITLISPLQSAPYIEITRKIMQIFGATVNENITQNSTASRGNLPQALAVQHNNSALPIFSFQGQKNALANQIYISPQEISVDGDWSSAAFWLCAAAISGEITVNNLNLNSPQGDKKIIEILKSFGAEITVGESFVTVCHNNLRAVSIDASEFPDLVPAIAAVACCAEGQTQISGISRLRLKESDRVEAIISAISALGGDIYCENDTIFIRKSKLLGGKPNVFADHRIAMMCAISVCCAKGEISVSNTDCIAKSYPNFLNDFLKLGGNFYVINNGK